MFDEKEYWISRHKKYKNDSRSVGSLSFSSTENDEIYNNFSEHLKRFLPAIVLLIRGKELLDFGCGTGLYSQAMIDVGFNYTGIDISPLAIEQAKKYCPKGTFYVDSIMTFNSPQKYDLIFVRTVLIHLVEEQDWNMALDTISRLLKNDGMFILIDEIPEQSQKSADHVNYRSYIEYSNALKRRNMCFTKEIPNISYTTSDYISPDYSPECYHSIRFCKNKGCDP